ncbi:MAG: hypothetical protein L7H18_03675 [Candidatus Nealsonbacteria bacterium DGGOD1a]|nr:MAG: hypothetical protein L7H18_03675 [Candidatus Nealsonbacteria bacterium DGGOD1a]
MIENKKPATMAAVVKSTVLNLNIDDLTLDNGIENKQHEQFGLLAYFCDPHHSWQKSHIENSIGLVRRWFVPKKIDLKNISEEQFQDCLHILNGKYRKSLRLRSFAETWYHTKNPALSGVKILREI